MLDQVSLRPGGDRNDAVRPPNGTRHHRPEEEAVARSHELRLTLERKVVDRHNGGRCETGSDDVLEVCDRRLQAAQQAGERPGHPPRLAAGRKLDGLDAVRQELRVPGHSGEAKLVVKPRELAKQRRDVALVPGPLTSEYVGIEHDQQLAHPATSR